MLMWSTITSFSTWNVHTEKEKTNVPLNHPLPYPVESLLQSTKVHDKQANHQLWSGILISSTTVESSNYVNSQIIMHQQTYTTSFAMAGIKGRQGTLKEGNGFTGIHL